MTNTESAVRAARSASMTGDAYLLNTDAPRQDEQQAQALQQWRECCDHDCNEGRDCPNRDDADDLSPWVPIVTLILLAIACFALAPEIAGLLSALFH